MCVCVRTRAPVRPRVLIVARHEQGWQLEELHLQREQEKLQIGPCAVVSEIQMSSGDVGG